MSGKFNWREGGLVKDALGHPQMLRLETISSLMQKLNITEEKAKLLIEKVKTVGHL